MSSSTLIGLAVALAAATVLTVTTAACRQQADSALAGTPAAGNAAAPRVWHVVSFRFKSDAATATAVHDHATNPDGTPTLDHTGAPTSVIGAFADLQQTVVAPDDPGRKLIQSFNAGMNNSTEQASFGTLGKTLDRTAEITFITTFRDCVDRDEYVERAPTHQAFKKLVAQYFATDAGNAVFVTDFLDGVMVPRGAPAPAGSVPPADGCP